MHMQMSGHQETRQSEQRDEYGWNEEGDGNTSFTMSYGNPERLINICIRLIK